MKRFVITGKNQSGENYSLPEINITYDNFIPTRLEVYNEDEEGKGYLENIYDLKAMKPPAESFSDSYYGTTEPEARAKIILDMILSALKHDHRVALSIIEANILVGSIDYQMKQAVEDYNSMGEKYGAEDRAEFVPPTIKYKRNKK